MASGDTLLVLVPQLNEPPSSAYATLELRNGHLLLSFDDTTDESAIFKAILPRSYDGGGVTVYLHWLGGTATSGNVVWDAQFERLNTDIDADSFAAVQSVTDAANATSGIIEIAEITFTDGAQMDSLAVGEAFRLKVTRDANNGSDTMSGDAQLIAIEIKES